MQNKVEEKIKELVKDGVNHAKLTICVEEILMKFKILDGNKVLSEFWSICKDGEYIALKDYVKGSK